MNIIKKIKNIDYRHYICIAILLISVYCSIVIFPNAFYRILEAGRDLGLSLAYYFCKLLRIPFDVNVTVNEVSKHTININDFMPTTFEAFKSKFTNLNVSTVSVIKILLKTLILISYRSE